MMKRKAVTMCDSPLLAYYDISDGVVAFSTTRHGGCGRGNYATFNINDYCGDSSIDVLLNRNLLAKKLGIDASRIVVPYQTHGTEVRRVDAKVLSLPIDHIKSYLHGVDALMTSEPGICIGVSTADCIPVLLYDVEHGAVCAIHAGWRGTQSRIVKKAVEQMVQTFHTRPSVLKAVIGPGISISCFEVGDEVYNQFANAGFDMNSISWRMDKWHIDLPKSNFMQLQETGVSTENILVTDICTYSNSEDYFSARRLGINSGRIYSGIILL